MKRWRIPAAGVVTALVLISGYFFTLHQPRSADIAEVKADADQLRGQQMSLRREINGLEQVAARQTEFRKTLELLERLIPSGLAQPSLLVQLQAAAEAAGVELVSVAFGDLEVPKDAPQSHVPGTVLAAMPVTVIVDGVYLRITDLLRRVEALDRAVLVGTLALTEAEARFPQLRGTWSGQAFALVPADGPLVKDPNAPGPQATASAEQPQEPAPTARR